MINIIDPSNCCGCMACVSICSQQAINMNPDVLGFLYPEVDTNKCIQCGLCEKVCAFNDNYDKSLNLAVPDVYGVRHKDMTHVTSSRSGAAFIAISDYILQSGGVVYGAGYTEHFRVAHKRATTPGERDEFKGSKYVQSDLDNIFRQVRKDLDNGFIVLFSGTPCQTAGLNSFIGKRLRRNLYLVDIVCHGVPSPYIWRDYLNYIENKYGEVISVNFRDKVRFGWTANKASFKFRGNIELVSNEYTYLFYEHIMLRHSCGKCHYANLLRPSDITIGDFWGWEKVDPIINADDKGLSLVLINTVKGRILFDKIKNDLNCIRTDTNHCMQPNLEHPSEVHPQRMNFERDYLLHGFNLIIKKYGNNSWRYLAKLVKYRMKRVLKILLRK